MKKTQTTQEVQEPSIEKEVQEVQKNAPDQAAQTPAREYLRKKYTPEEMEQGHCAATAQKTLEEIGIEKLQEIQKYISRLLGNCLLFIVLHTSNGLRICGTIQKLHK